MSATLNARDPARVLILADQPLMVDLVKLTLNHGVFDARDASDVPAATRMLQEWQPHLAVIDMDLAGGELLERIGRPTPSASTRLPVLALTRRGDLKSKLAAFEQGVDDIMTVPFSPEELLARVLAITRRSYGAPIPLIPVLKVGDLEIDILNRRVRLV